MSGTRDSEDERIVRVELTSAGKQLRRAVSAIQKFVACQTQLPASELADFRARLQALTETMNMAQLTESTI